MIDNNSNNTGENTGKEIREQKTTEEIFRITVTKEAEKALIDLVDKVNRGFDGGKINRTEMASWALMRLNRNMDEPTLQEVRAEHFDEIAALEILWRKAKERGRVSSEVKQLLLKEIGFDGASKKSAKTKIDKDIHQ